MIAKDPLANPTTVARPNEKAVNQISIHKQGCGPCCLLNAYKFGSKQWKAPYQAISGSSDQAKFHTLINKYGKRLSSHSLRRRRWSYQTGISAVDLTDIANDIHGETLTTKLIYHNLFIKENESYTSLLKRAHRHFQRSLSQGFPPIISINRFAKQRFRQGYTWTQIHGHYVIVYEIPKSLGIGATSFEIKYLDPWGGKIKTGTIKIPENGFFTSTHRTNMIRTYRPSPSLQIDFPETSLGKNKLKKGQESATTLSSTITPQLLSFSM